VLETRPGEAVSIIECDMDVEFAKPIDYIEPEIRPKKEEEPEEEPEMGGVCDFSFIPFLGSGNRLDGKSVPIACATAAQLAGQRRGIPDYDFRIGQLNFCRNMKFSNNGSDGKNDRGFKAFGGAGTALKAKTSKS